MAFDMTETERATFKNWLANHRCQFWDGDKPKLNEEGFPNTGAIGGMLTYCFTPTGLGPVIVVRCACGGEENITDFGSW